MSSQLGTQDAQFLYAQSGDVLTHVMSINVFAPRREGQRALEYRSLVRHVAARAHLAPVYGSRLHRLPGDLDLPYWVEVQDLDVDAHVQRARLPKPGNWTQFCRLAARRFEEPMDLGRPLWDILLVEGLDGVPWIEPGSCVLLQRFHHAAIDGASGAHALAALCDLDRRGTPAIAGPPPSVPAASPPAALTAVARALRSGVATPARMLGALRRHSPGLASALAGAAATGHARLSPPPVTRFNDRISRRRRFAAARARLDELRAIAALVPGATVNDVILTICGGALRAYLARHGELPADSLSAIVPINARRAGHADGPAGNDVTAMTIPLATDVADDVARLRSIRSWTRDAKQGKAGLGTRLLADVSRELPGAVLPWVMRLIGGERVLRSQGNLIVTNVPGASRTLYLRGARLTHQFGMGPLAHGLGLFIAANGYDGEISFCITADPGLVPDPAFLCRCIDSARRRLRRAAAQGGFKALPTAGSVPAWRRPRAPPSTP